MNHHILGVYILTKLLNLAAAADQLHFQKKTLKKNLIPTTTHSVLSSHYYKKYNKISSKVTFSWTSRMWRLNWRKEKMKATRNKIIILKRLQKGGRNTIMANKWAKFTLKYSMTRFMRSGGGMLLVKSKGGPILLIISNIKWEWASQSLADTKWGQSFPTSNYHLISQT